MKHIKAVAGYILILSLCLVCAHPAHAETRRIALIHSFEPGYPPAAKALELLQKEFSLLGLDCDVREYYLDCDRYMEEAENLRMAGFVDDLSAGSRVDSRARRPGCLCADGMQTPVGA